MVWTGAWGDAAVEKAAAQELINKDCDVLTKHQDTAAVLLAAEEAEGVSCIGYHYPTADVAPNSYLTAPVWDWGPYYVEQVQKIIDGTWESESYWGSEVVKLDTLLTFVPKVRKTLLKKPRNGLIPANGMYSMVKSRTRTAM